MARTSKKQSFESLHQLLILKLQSLYDIEQQLVKALPKMAEHAVDENLKDAFLKHLEETKMQVARLERALESLQAPVKSEKVEAIRGLIKDADWVMKHAKDAAADAGTIAAAQYVEHYEMAGYGAAKEWAELMGHDEVVSLLDESLKEEKAADEKLNELAHAGINERANNDM